MNPLDVQLAKLAAGQHSVVTRQQALSLGMTARQIDRRVDVGGLIVLHRSTYGLAGSRPTYERALMAACLATGGAASHRAAAHLWGLRGLEEAPVEITVSDRRHPRLHGVTIHRSALAVPAHLTRREGIPLTKPALTILTLGAVAPELVQGAAEDALFKKLLRVEGLWHILGEAGAPGRDGTRVLRRLLLARDPAQAPTESVLEIVAILSRYGLPEPVRQHRVPRPGRRPLRLDVSYPEALVDIEGDGLRWHTSTEDVRRDRERANYLVANGWVILCFTRDDVRHRPAELAAQVRKVRADRLRAAS